MAADSEPHTVPFVLEDEFYVRCSDASVNERHTQSEVFVCMDPATNTPVARADLVPKGTIACAKCGVTFSKYSALCAHEAKPCPPPATPAVDEPRVRIDFPAEKLELIGDVLSAMSLAVTHADGRASIEYARSRASRLLDTLYYCQCNFFNMERWYERLQAHAAASLPAGARAPTARSVFVALSDDDLAILRKVYSRGELGSTLSRVESDQLGRLETRLREAIDTSGLPLPLFVRTSTRSPKDAATAASTDGVTGSEAALLASIQRMQVRTAQDIIRLVGRSTRCYSDFGMYLSFRVPGAPGESMSIILREWIDVPLSSEFRCFVHRGHLTAISQYHCYTVVPSLQDAATVRAVRKAIGARVAWLLPALPSASCIVDVCYDGRPSDVALDAADRVLLIEVNPFGADLSSGSGLFSWTRDRDLLLGVDASVSDLPAIRVLRELHESHATVQRVAPGALFSL